MFQRWLNKQSVQIPDAELCIKIIIMAKQPCAKTDLCYILGIYRICYLLFASLETLMSTEHTCAHTDSHTDSPSAVGSSVAGRVHAPRWRSVWGVLDWFWDIDFPDDLT